MWIWLDDVRKKPDHFDIWFKSGKDLVNYIKKGKHISFISFDHDLSFKHYFGLNPFNKMTGYDVASFIEELAYHNKIKRFPWAVHSQNPVGAKRIIQAMENCDKYWLKHEGAKNES